MISTSARSSLSSFSHVSQTTLGSPLRMLSSASSIPSLAPSEAHSLVSFLNASPTAYHAVATSITSLEAAGFKRLSEKEDWGLSELQKRGGGRFYVTRNQSSLIAFTIPKDIRGDAAANIVGTHTDSPHWRVRPRSWKEAEGYLQVGVETYGGGLWQTWVDRDLSLAGRIFVATPSGVKSHLVQLPIDKPILRIPTLAVHLGRAQGEKQEYNLETEMTPIIGIKQSLEKAFNVEVPKKDGSREADHHPVLLRLLADHLTTSLAEDISPSQIKDFDLHLYDTVPSTLGGAASEFVISGRLDNLFSTFSAVEALIRSTKSATAANRINVVASWDNEEIGSTSAFGAESSFLPSILERLAGASYRSFMARSFLLSSDMGHAIHPAFPSKHESNMKPIINGGPVLKTNAKQRYASTGETRTLVKQVAELAGVPLQEYEVRNDMACGSTIGPLVSVLGLRTVDVGAPQWSMHSVRETAGSVDVKLLIDLFATFFERFG
ncbi:aspartyl aminopeptidase, partial [Atractiella rhizophila]